MSLLMIFKLCQVVVSVIVNINRLCSTLSRTSLVLLIGVDTIRVVMRDGRTCVLSFEDKELRDLLSWQVSWSG